MTDPRYLIADSDRDTARDLSAVEMLCLYHENRCPFCQTPRFYFWHGPRGGMSVNVECMNCRARFNVIDVDRVGRWYAWGQLLRRPIDGFIKWRPKS